MKRAFTQFQRNLRLLPLALPFIPLCSAMAAPTVTEPSFSIQIAAARSENLGGKTGFDIVETIGGTDIKPDRPILQMAHVVFNVPTAVNDISGLTAKDSRGPVRLTARESGEGDAAVRQWFVDRQVQGPLIVRYSVTVAQVAAPRGAAPPIDLRDQEGAISGSGATFLLRPSEGRYHFDVQWKASSFDKQAAMVSSLDGFEKDLLPAETIAASYFMVGRIKTFGSTTGARGFRGAVQGSPAFDPDALIDWSARLYDRYQHLFSVPEKPYTVFVRRNTINPGGGYGLHRSFIVTFDKAKPRELDDLKSVLAHEMFHTFQPMIWNPGSADGALDQAWFDEGLAVYYQVVLPYRYGMMSTDEYARQINVNAGRFYTNALAGTPNDQVPQRFWQDTRIRTIPYDRGFLYFASVDHAIRAASGGKRSLDDLMLELRRKVDAGETLSAQSWQDAIRAELGEAAVTEWRGMMSGSIPLPTSDAFGSCLERVSKPLRRYELGFEPTVLVEPRRIVRGIKPGSAAALAGLRNGDEIMKPVGQDALQGDQDGMLTLEVQRDQQKMTIAYKPRGELVQAWQWQVRKDAPSGNCALPGR